MGRFYKTARGRFVDDVIYQAPHELMAKALQVQDKNFNDTVKPLEGTELLYEGLDYVDKDSAARQKKMKEYNDTITALSEEAHKNPSLARGLRGKINQARAAIEHDVKAGDFHQMDRTAKRRTKLIKSIEDRKDITDSQKKTFINELDYNYKGFDAAEDNTFADSMHIYEALDEEKFIKDKKAELTADAITTKTNRTDGRYFTTTTGQRKFISDERLRESFEDSTGVDKWQKARLQELDSKVKQGLMNQDEADFIYKEERETFKQDFIKSLGFEQTNDSELLSTDGRDLREQANARAWGNYNKTIDNSPMEETEIDTDEILTSDKEYQMMTADEKKNYDTNARGLAIKEKLGGKFEGIRDALKSNDPKVRNAAAAQLISGEGLSEPFTPGEVADLRGFVFNKHRVFTPLADTKEKAIKLEKQARDTFLATPDDVYVNVKYTNEDGVDVIKEVPMHEAKKLTQGTKQVKVKKEKKLTMIKDGKEVLAYKDGKILIPITTKDKKYVTEAEYESGGEYEGGNVPGVVKTEEMETQSVPFTIKNSKRTTNSNVNYRFIDEKDKGVKTKVTNHHFTGPNGRDVVISINSDGREANIRNTSNELR